MSRPEAAGPSRGAASASPAAPAPRPRRSPPSAPLRHGGQRTVSRGRGGWSRGAAGGRAGGAGQVSADTPARPVLPSLPPPEEGGEGGAAAKPGEPPVGDVGRGGELQACWKCRDVPAARRFGGSPGKVNSGRAGAVPLVIRQPSSFSSRPLAAFAAGPVWVFRVVGGF